MITLYTWGTPNGRKVSIKLDECARPSAIRAIDSDGPAGQTIELDDYPDVARRFAAIWARPAVQRGMKEPA